MKTEQESIVTAFNQLLSRTLTANITPEETNALSYLKESGKVDKFESIFRTLDDQDNMEVDSPSEDIKKMHLTLKALKDKEADFLQLFPTELQSGAHALFKRVLSFQSSYIEFMKDQYRKLDKAMKKLAETLDQTIKKPQKS